MKVFWSWQSDTPGKTGRHFIRAALKDAIKVLKQPEEVEEPMERDNKDALHLDQDRQGVPGSPDLARTILDKIDIATAFVADVTPVSIIPAKNEFPEKRNINPNVAIELGYALRALGDVNVLMVLNTHYGGREFLPFDLAHKGGPIMFDLPPDADKIKMKSEAAQLKDKFVNALRHYIQQQSGVNAAVAFNRTPSTTSQVHYSQPKETLAEFGEECDFVEFSYPDDRGFYMRLIPQTSPSKPIIRSVLMSEVKGSGLYAMWENPSNLFSYNSYGVIVVEPLSHRDASLKASTQVFLNGEIWGINSPLLVDNEHGKFVPGMLFERTLRKTLHQYVNFISNSLKIAPPYTVEVGAVGLSKYYIVYDQFENALGPIYDNEFRVERILNDTSETSIDQVLLTIFEELYNLSGYTRPASLYGFPEQTAS